LARAGFIAAEEEAAELMLCAGGDGALLEALLERRLTGEPLAWITGKTTFCGIEIAIDPGVYVPRWQSEPLARRAAGRLGVDGVAIDLCTGSGAVAKTIMAARPAGGVFASDLDPRALACARRNGVDAYLGDLFDPIPPALAGKVDVIVGVVPYVPTADLPLLQRDTFSFESPLSYDGGPDGTDVLRRVIRESPRFLRRGGALLLEVGGRQAEALRAELDQLGYRKVALLHDEEGDLRGLEATIT
jgi:release factor glutamine methyltransferase